MVKSVVLSSFVLFFSSGAHAFTLNSSNDPNFKGWANAEIKFDVNASNCPASVNVVSLIEDAVEVWNGIATSKVEAKYGTSTNSTTYKNPTTVYCETNFSGVTGANDDYVPGAASIQRSGSNASGGLLILNVSSGQGNIANFNNTLLKVLVAHEIGHILGLGHSEDVNALMYYDASLKQNLRLSQDDVDGMTYLYSRDELGKDPIMGCGTVRSLPPPTNGLILLIAGFLLAPIAVSLYLRHPNFLRSPR